MVALIEDDCNRIRTRAYTQANAHRQSEAGQSIELVVKEEVDNLLRLAVSLATC